MFTKLRTEEAIDELLNNEGKKNVTGQCLLNGIALGLLNIREASQKLLNSFMARNMLSNSCHLNLFSDRSPSSFFKDYLKIIKLSLFL